jgi:hypothetical protein
MQAASPKPSEEVPALTCLPTRPRFCVRLQLLTRLPAPPPRLIMPAVAPSWPSGAARSLAATRATVAA